jgi:hypothetical protein
MSEKESVRLLVMIDGKEEIKASASGSDKPWKTTTGTHVVSLSVDLKIDAPDAFSLQFLATHEGKRTVYDHVKEGSKIELGLGYSSTTPIFEGEVVYIDGEYSADNQTPSLVTIRGYDKSHRLTRGHSAKSMGDGKTETDVSGDYTSVLSGSKSGHGDVSDSLSAPADATNPTFKSRWTPKPTGTNYDFLRSHGSGRKLDISKSPVATIFADKPDGTNPLSVMRIRFSISTYPSYAKVRVRGWNPATKQGFVAEVTKCSDAVNCAQANSAGGWKPGWEHAGKAHWGSSSAGAVYDRVAEYTETKEEATQIAQGIFDAMSLKHLTGEAEVQGDPKIVPGAVVELKGFGPRASGKVLVTEATHSVSANGSQYITAFKFVSNASGAPT